jgi:hypothetical protein
VIITFLIVIPAKAQGCPGKIGFSGANIDAKLKNA